MSAADLDALDRGVLEAGLTAAEAMARIEALEAQVGVIFSMMREMAAVVGLPVPTDPAQPQLRAGR